MKSRKDGRGVTLMELLIVMVIIGILVGLLVPVTIRIQKNAAENRVLGRLTALRTAIISYYTYYGVWPMGHPETGGAYSSREVISHLRPNGLNNPRKKLFWEAEDEVRSLAGVEYKVVFNPSNRIPVTDKTEYKSKTMNTVTVPVYSVYFTLQDL